MTTTDHKPPIPSNQLTDAQVNQVCRPPALRFSKEMVGFANKKFKGYSPFWCPIIAGMTMQNVIIMSLLESFEAGTDEGAIAINKFFDKCKFDATNQWRSDTFKNQFGGKKKNLVSV